MDKAERWLRSVKARGGSSPGIGFVRRRDVGFDRRERCLNLARQVDREFEIAKSVGMIIDPRPCRVLLGSQERNEVAIHSFPCSAWECRPGRSASSSSSIREDGNRGATGDRSRRDGWPRFKNRGDIVTGDRNHISTSGSARVRPLPGSRTGATHEDVCLAPWKGMHDLGVYVDLCETPG
jgi:hypothetical protein